MYSSGALMEPPSQLQYTVFPAILKHVAHSAHPSFIIIHADRPFPGGGHEWRFLNIETPFFGCGIAETDFYCVIISLLLPA